ncbi:hypothetical protein [Pseudonocardia endophytica]|nr:hypothetical protein [Pseudonocardia endophytica]
MTDAPPAATPSRPSTRSWTTLWYYAVVVLTIGLLSGVPFGHAATRLRGMRRVWCVVSAVAYTAVMVVAVVISTVYRDSPTPVGGMIMIITIVVAIVHLTFVRRWVHTAPQPRGYDPAVGAVLHARGRRDEARRIVERDPSMARELRIGRPDLPRTFDDGGLVDLNSAPAAVIAQVCGVDPAVGQQLVDARTAAGTPFVRVDDVFTYSDVPYPLWDRIRERAVVVP